MEKLRWPDYQTFAALFGADAIEGRVQRLGTGSAVPLFGVWVLGDREFLGC